MSHNQYKELINKTISSDKETFLFFKGRVALYAILKAMNIQAGDEVILPAFTCVVVPNAILYLNAKPVYVDIKPETYTMDPLQIKSKITSKTKIIILQNTFGLSMDIERILNIARNNNLYTIEDCTHGFGGRYNNQFNGTLCDASFFSTQWNKPFSTGIGGFAIVANTELNKKMEQLESDACLPSFTQSISIYFQLAAHRLLITDQSYWLLRRGYRWLSKHNIVTGSSQGEEVSSTKIPHNYFQAMSTVQIKAGIKALLVFNDLQNKRIENAKSYTAFLKKNNKNHVPESVHDNHGFLTYPLLVFDRVQFMENAEKAKIKLGDWFISPIHPVKSNFGKWNIMPSDYPIALEICQHIVNLPTDIKDINRVLQFLDSHKSHIMSL